MNHLLRTPLILAVLLAFVSGCTQITQNSKQDITKNVAPDASASASETAEKEALSPEPTVTPAEAEPAEDGVCSADAAPAEADPSEPAGADEIPTEENAIQTLLDEALEFCQVSQGFWQKGELDRAIEALDHAYSLILKADGFQNVKMAQDIDDLRFTISKRILEIYASRNVVVNGNHNAIPVVVNDHVQKEINLFTRGGDKSFFKRAYVRSGKYRDMIVKKLEAAGLPPELSWLPLIESGFKVNALSRARALGLWQFIPSTGYKFGLKRNTYVDERLDPEKSTRAAIDYMKELHQIFGDWMTVLAAYNCGEGRVLKVIRGQNVNYLDNFWDLYERLPYETARYVPKFLATLHILNHPDEYGLSDLAVCSPDVYKTVAVPKRTRLRDIAKALDVPCDVLEDLNPELRYKTTPADGYALKAPPDKADLLVAHLDKIPAAAAPRASYYKYHKIRRGETLSTIARRYKTSVSRIMRANKLSSRHRIRAGKVLKIPSRGGVSYAKSDPEPAKTTARKPQYAAAAPSSHTVKRGDSLWNIARRYHVTVKEIQAANRLSGTRLHIGQDLKIPGRVKKLAVKTEKLKVYLVKRGDVPGEIARKHNMDLSHFLQVNRLRSSSVIYPGQKLYVE